MIGLENIETNFSCRAGHTAISRSYILNRCVYKADWVQQVHYKYEGI